MKIVRCALLALLLAAPAALADDEPVDPLHDLQKDRFHAALGAMQVKDGQLGYRPKAHWPRYPHSRTVPYVLPFFDDLLAAPLDTYMFTRTLGNAVEDLLTPELLRAEPTDGKRGKETLYKLGVMLATERRIGGFRVFGMDTAHLPEPTKGEDPLGRAIEALLATSGTPIRDLPSHDAVPEPLRPGLALLIRQLMDARTWIDRGLRHVTPAMRRGVFEILPRLAESTPDGTEYFPVIDDVARVLDEHSLHYGCLKALQAVQNARRTFGVLPVPEDGWPEFEFRLDTAWGRILFDNDSTDTQSCEEPFLIVRFGPGNSLESPAGATSPERPLSVALLLDTEGRVGSSYGGSVQDDPQTYAQLASGILGCGIVYASGDGDHYYKTDRWAQGAGLFGLGALIDEGGDDHYLMASVGQGAGFFGAGLLLDAAGDDRYELAEGDGQGFGGPNGIGVLGDRSGDDTYYAEPDAKKAGRADYHSEEKIAVSNAQGVGSGRRGDISDGHVWAGGLGALIDVEGKDRYEAGNFSQGLGYWYGTGLMWDGGGDDVYRSVYFTQGSGAHFAIGALVDEGGHDRHELWETAGAALAFGWDVVNAFLIDRGAGNDYYEADRISIGVAEVRSNAFFLDEGGDDTYVVRAEGKFLGDVDDREGYKVPGRTADFPWRLAQVAMFLDLGGKDRYLARDKDGKETPLEHAKDGATWHLKSFIDMQAMKDALSGRGHLIPAPNVSYGGDFEDGWIGFLLPFPRRGAPASDGR